MILSLQPVTFRYKHELDADGIPQFGLVAEEVEKVNPDLVGSDRGRKSHDSSLRSGKREVTQQVPERAPRGGGTREESIATRSAN